MTLGPEHRDGGLRPEPPPPAPTPPQRRIPPRAVAATALLLLAAALAVADAPAGLALALAGAGVAGVALLAGGVPRERGRALILGAAVGLALTPVLRDAGWVVAIDLVLAFLCGAVALVGDRSALGVLRGPARAVTAMPDGLAAVAAALARALPRPAGRQVAPLLRGGVLAAGLLAVFGALFVSADRAFAHLAQAALPEAPDLGGLPGRLGVTMAFAAVTGALLVARERLRLAGPAAGLPAPARRLSAAEWLPALVALVGLFAAFVILQSVVLFGGHAHVLDTAGLTYAEYARQGFGQLIVVTVCVLALVAACRRWAAAAGWQAAALRGLLVALCACTLVIVASALFRLDVYVEAYGATRLRVQAAALGAFLGATVVCTAAAVAAGRTAWLPRAVVLLAAGVALAVTVADPDRRIAERNVDRFERTGRIDTSYLRGLSADAVPALVRLPARQRAEVGLTCPPADDGIAGLNAGRVAARRALEC